jgi:tripartite-type tricarboxylate transporter receptor subunit TctC
MAGRITYYFSPISAALPLIKDGRVVALAVSSAQRSSVLKDVPTVAESGLPGFDYNLWVALFGPAGMPADLVERINRDVQRAAQSPEVKERFANLGAEPMPMSVAQFRTFIADELAVNHKVVQAAGIKAQ